MLYMTCVILYHNHMQYEPKNFSDLFDSPIGHQIWEVLNEPDNILRMETATFLRRTAVEPLSPVLLKAFGDVARGHRVKQMIGHMVRQILEARGYSIDRVGVRIKAGNIFASGTRYNIPSEGSA